MNVLKMASSREAGRRGLDLLRNVFAKYGIAIAFILLCIVMGILSDKFLTAENAINVLRQVSFVGILSIGMCLVLITGGIDLSVGSSLCMAGVIAALCARDGTEMPLIVALLAGIAAGIALGALNGALITVAKVPPFIATLAVYTATRGAVLLAANGRPVINLTSEFKVIGSGRLWFIPYPVLIFLAITVVGYCLLKHTRFGKYIYAIGGNELAAKVSGVNVKRNKMYVYMFCGMLSAIAGVVLASRVGTGSPIAGEGYELDAIAASVIGGTSLSGGVGSIGGTIIGVLIIGVISNGMDILNISSYYQQIVKGAIIALAVILDRKGK
jgi:ribose/xylose/arabinose/galactoside ABC-type transport system permease subunit